MGSPAFYTMVLKYMKVGQHYYSTPLSLYYFVSKQDASIGYLLPFFFSLSAWIKGQARDKGWLNGLMLN